MRETSSVVYADRPSAFRISAAYELNGRADEVTSSIGGCGTTVNDHARSEAIALPPALLTPDGPPFTVAVYLAP